MWLARTQAFKLQSQPHLQATGCKLPARGGVAVAIQTWAAARPQHRSSTKKIREPKGEDTSALLEAPSPAAIFFPEKIREIQNPAIRVLIK